MNVMNKNNEFQNSIMEEQEYTTESQNNMRDGKKDQNDKGPHGKEKEDESENLSQKNIINYIYQENNKAGEDNWKEENKKQVARVLTNIQSFENYNTIRKRY